MSGLPIEAREPNMVDVALAIPEAGEVLSLIADHMAADAKHRQDMQDAWYIQALAEAKAMHDGVSFALLQCEYGGTTREYNTTLKRIELAVSNARFEGPIRRWYIEQFTEDRFSEPVHPNYIVDYGP